MSPTLSKNAIKHKKNCKGQTPPSPLNFRITALKLVLNGTNGLIWTFSNFLVFVCFIMTSSRVDFRHTPKIYVSKIQNFEFFKIHFFLLKKVNNLKITQKFCYSTFPKCYRGVTSEKPQNIENFEKLFLRRTPLDPLRIIQSTPNFFWRRSTYIN